MIRLGPGRGRARWIDRPSTADNQSAQILGWHDRIELELFRRALRREPFVIKRSTASAADVS
jgi:hypothetical protein